MAVSAILEAFEPSSLDCCQIQHSMGMRVVQLELVVSGWGISASLCLAGPFAKRQAWSEEALAPGAFPSMTQSPDFRWEMRDGLKPLLLTVCLFAKSPLERGHSWQGSASLASLCLLLHQPPVWTRARACLFPQSWHQKVVILEVPRHSLAAFCTPCSSFADG